MKQQALAGFEKYGKTTRRRSFWRKLGSNQRPLTYERTLVGFTCPLMSVGVRLCY